MKSIRKSRFFLPIAMLLAVAGTCVSLNANSQEASALTGCQTQLTTRTVTATSRWNSQIVLSRTYNHYDPLKIGSRGSCVASLQKMANMFCREDTWLGVDGIFGQKTYSAVKSIQYAFANDPYYIFRVNGSAIGVDGQVGPQTWSVMQAGMDWGWASTYGGNVNCKAYL